jgi:hypothetical protein
LGRTLYDGGGVKEVFGKHLLPFNPFVYRHFRHLEGGEEVFFENPSKLFMRTAVGICHINTGTQGNSNDDNHPRITAGKCVYDGGRGSDVHFLYCDTVDMGNSIYGVRTLNDFRVTRGFPDNV